MQSHILEVINTNQYIVKDLTVLHQILLLFFQHLLIYDFSSDVLIFGNFKWTMTPVVQTLNPTQYTIDE